MAREPADGLSVTLEPVRNLTLVAPEWRKLESQAPVNPYLSFVWLESWAETYRPTGLRLLRVDGPDGLHAAALFENLPWGRPRFAGAPISPSTGLLCRSGDERLAWAALRRSLSPSMRVPWLEARGTQLGFTALPGCLARTEPWLETPLAPTFDAYLQRLPAPRRRELRRRLRRSEEAGFTFRRLSGAEARPALLDFVRLHRARASQKGEVHRAIDERLAQMLASMMLRDAGAVSLHTLAQAETTLAVAIDLEQRDEIWAYNIGFDPAFSRFSPGLVLRMHTIADAIARGKRRYDLGPGDSVYKRELGGRPANRLVVQLTGPGLIGAGALTALRIRERVREVDWVRQAVRRFRLAA